MQDSVQDKKVLNTQYALSLIDNDTSLYKDLLISFISDMPFDTEKLITLIKENKLEEAAKYIHLVKGAGSQIGAERLAYSGQNLEDVLRGKKEGPVEELCAKAVSDYRLTVAQVKDTINQI